MTWGRLSSIGYRYCGNGEALGGSKVARRGIALLIGGCELWERAIERYRVIVFGKGCVRDAAKLDRDVDVEKTR